MRSEESAGSHAVCLVDDDPLILDSLRHLLASNGIATRSFLQRRDFPRPHQDARCGAGGARYLDRTRDRFGSVGETLRTFAANARDYHHRSRRSGGPGYRNANRSGGFFHQAVQRREISRRCPRRAYSNKEFVRI